jgi:hypothetical protein
MYEELVLVMVILVVDSSVVELDSEVVKLVNELSVMMDVVP